MSATTLRLCAVGDTADQVWLPVDTLQGAGVGRVLVSVVSQPRVSGQQACTAEQGPDFLLVAETDGQAPIVMMLQLYGCRLVGLADQPRKGADAVLQSFKTELSKQRAANLTRIVRPGPLCGRFDQSPTPLMPLQPRDLIGGRLCRYESRDAAAQELTLSNADVRAIVDDVVEHRVTAEPAICPYVPQPPLKLVLYTWFGDPLVLVGDDCTGRYTYQTTYNGAGQEWRPSSSVAKRLDALAGR